MEASGQVLLDSLISMEANGQLLSDSLLSMEASGGWQSRFISLMVNGNQDLSLWW
ncbi:unnamed protein product [Absidia cylindrospora]